MKRKKGRIVLYFILAVLFILTIIPFVWMLLTSFRSMSEITKQGPLHLPTELHFENYIKAWINGNFDRYYVNSLFITGMVVIIVLLVTVLAAYAFTYLRFIGRKMLLSIILFGLLVPVELIVIPLFHDMKAFHLLNTHWAVILPQTAISIPLGIFVLNSFMRKIPKALLESARMDGATESRVLFSIILPVIKPAVISLLILTAMGCWNSFMLPNIMLQDDSMRTLTVGLSAFRTRFTVDYALSSAGAMIVAMPMIIVYLVFQRNIIEGMMSGSMKG